MKPKNLKCPFTWEDRCPLFTEGVLFVPQYYDLHREGIAKLRFGSKSALFEQDSDSSPIAYTDLKVNDSQVFARSAPVSVEYCSGNGAWIIDKAKQHPEHNWIAVEKRFDRVRKIWSKMKNAALDNLLIVCGEALTFTQFYLPDDCLAGSYINFPDPWPKDKHAKHRLFHEAFVKEMARVVCRKSAATIVTDDPRWAGQICHAMRSGACWSAVFPDPYFVTEWPQYGTSYFDELWREKGRTIHYMQFLNRKIS